MRRAKIVCTLGPASSSLESISALVDKGMDVARINCSHGSHEQLKSLYDHVRTAAKNLNRPVAILLDLQGPKIRIGTFSQGSADIKTGDKITITNQDVDNTAELISCSYTTLPAEVEPDDQILIDDGNVELKVLSSDGKEKVECEVLFGGRLSGHKGMNLPGTKLSTPALTEKDRADLLFGLDLGVDYVALSFVRKPDDVREAQDIIKEKGLSTPVIAKIEKPQAVKCIDDIIAVAGGMMVARGDMAVEISPEQVPAIQKQIIYKCNEAGIPVILATQMLESMIHNARPTRAEASDVANGVFDGASALMLSAETATGDHPAHVVQIMTDIINRAERDQVEFEIEQKTAPPPVVSIPDAIENSAALIANQLNARAICCVTNTGRAAQALSKFRPDVPIFALTDNTEALQKLALIWGVKGIFINEIPSNDDSLDLIENTVTGWWNKFLAHVYRPISKGDLLVLTIGTPIQERKKTNTIRVRVVRGPSA